MCVHIMNFSNDTKKSFNVAKSKAHGYDQVMKALQIIDLRTKSYFAHESIFF